MSIPLTAFSAEVPSELIQLYGDWSSDAFRLGGLCGQNIDIY